MNLPNKLSLFRMFLVPLIVFVMIFPFAEYGIHIPSLVIGSQVILGKNIVALVLFAIASITDFVDGFIARKYELVTTFGKFIDPVADKLLVNTMFILFAFQGIVQFVPIIVMIWRDSLVDGIRMISSEKKLVLAANSLGKIKTVSQIFTIILLFIGNYPFEQFGIPVASFMVWFSMLISVVSGISYFIQVKHLFLSDM